jgi:hypothetical protein
MFPHFYLVNRYGTFCICAPLSSRTPAPSRGGVKKRLLQEANGIISQLMNHAKVEIPQHHLGISLRKGFRSWNDR